ncbi:TonB-dependent receptor [Sphingomicrobium sp. XHP0239]|uniref:TonB-dependent receptor n=1 Tax=Sphingomicrobium maritimum TaxID=3133972 RepID=UPI0031CCA622
MILALLAFQPADPAPIVVTGRALDDDAPAAITYDAEDAETLASGRIEELLARTPNLAAFRRADGRSVHPTSQGITARGLGGNAASRLALTIDGVPQADPFGGWINFAAIDPVAIDRLAVRYGADAQPGAVAGSIAIDTLARSPRTYRAAWGGDDRWDLSSSGHFEIGDGFVQTASGFIESDGFIPIVEEDRGPADRAARTEQRVSRGRLVYPLGGLEAQAGLAMFTDERDRGFDGSDNRAEGLDLSLRLVDREGALPFELTGWWQDRQFETRFAALDDARATTSVVLDQYDVPATGLGIEGQIDVGPASIGAGWRRYEGEVRERFLFENAAPTRERRAGGENRIYGLFGAADRDLGIADARLALRVDRWEIGEGFRTIDVLADGASLEDSIFAPRDGTEWSGRLDLTRDIRTLRLSAAAYRGWRLPTLNELYRPFRVGPDATAANEALDPETSYGLDIGARIGSPAFSAGVTLFAQRLVGAIANVPLDTGPGQFPGVGFVSGAGIYSQRQNLGGITSRGLELDATYETGPWQARLLYGFADATIDTSGAAAAFDGNRPQQSPRRTGSATIGWERGDTLAQLTARWEGARYEDLANSIELDSALTFDAFASIPLERRVALELRGENLADAQVLTDVLGDGTRERARGRTLWVGVKITP